MGGGSNSPTLSPAPTSKPPLPFRVLTHNIRYATTSPFPGESPWTVRKPKLCAQLLYHTRALPSTVIFLQEALDSQRTDIHACLNTHSGSVNWRCIGVGRDDGVKAGEFAPILFRGDVWGVVPGSVETVWLNETGEVGRRGWDAASVRIVTTVVLEDRTGAGGEGRGRRLLLMNTHLDDQGEVSRRESAEVILRECRARRERWDVDAVVLGGDLNSEVDGDAYPIIANFGESGVVDVRMLAGEEQVYGEENTFTGFDGRGDGDGLKRIDFLFLGTKEGNDFDPNMPGYAVLPNRFEDGVYLSDHRAVVADLAI
jgi:endonuclease/exonuclease/phosphatase family metal-dependent hydrolase